MKKNEAQVDRCDDCRFWSEMMAMSSHVYDDVVAMCLNPYSGCYQKYKPPGHGCEHGREALAGFAIDCAGAEKIYNADGSAKEDIDADKCSVCGNFPCSCQIKIEDVERAAEKCGVDLKKKGEPWPHTN